MRNGKMKGKEREWETEEREYIEIISNNFKCLK